jgi:hypothetical protein
VYHNNNDLCQLWFLGLAPGKSINEQWKANKAKVLMIYTDLGESRDFVESSSNTSLLWIGFINILISGSSV